MPTALIFLTEVVLTAPIFLTGLVAVLTFLTELVLTALIFLTRLALTAPILLLNSLALSLYLSLTALVLTVRILTFLTENGLTALITDICLLNSFVLPEYVLTSLAPTTRRYRATRHTYLVAVRHAKAHAVLDAGTELVARHLPCGENGSVKRS